MTDGQKKYELAYRAKLEALRKRDFARVQQEEEYMRKIRSGYGISHEDARRIQRGVEQESKTMNENPTYAVTTKWTDEEGVVFKRLHMRQAGSRKEAIAQEKEHNDRRLREGMQEEGWSYRVVDASARSNPEGEVSPTGGTGAGILAVGVLALIGGAIYVATRPDAPGGGGTATGGGGGGLPAPTPAPPGKPKCLDCAPSPTGNETEAESFAKASGYTVWCVENQAVSTWKPPKVEYSSDSKARAYSQVDCSFYKWEGTSWVKDEGANADLQNWRAQFVGRRHPVSAFTIGA